MGLPFIKVTVNIRCYYFPGKAVWLLKCLDTLKLNFVHKNVKKINAEATARDKIFTKDISYKGLLIQNNNLKITRGIVTVIVVPGVHRMLKLNNKKTAHPLN